MPDETNRTPNSKKVPSPEPKGASAEDKKRKVKPGEADPEEVQYPGYLKDGGSL